VWTALLARATPSSTFSVRYHTVAKTPTSQNGKDGRWLRFPSLALELRRFEEKRSTIQLQLGNADTHSLRYSPSYTLHCHSFDYYLLHQQCFFLHLFDLLLSELTSKRLFPLDCLAQPFTFASLTFLPPHSFTQPLSLLRYRIVQLV
jgi:hypothetical protein